MGRNRIPLSGRSNLASVTTPTGADSGRAQTPKSIRPRSAAAGSRPPSAGVSKLELTPADYRNGADVQVSTGRLDRGPAVGRMTPDMTIRPITPMETDRGLWLRSESPAVMTPVASSRGEATGFGDAPSPAGRTSPQPLMFTTRRFKLNASASSATGFQATTFVRQEPPTRAKSQSQLLSDRRHADKKLGEATLEDMYQRSVANQVQQSHALAATTGASTTLRRSASPFPWAKQPSDPEDGVPNPRFTCKSDLDKYRKQQRMPPQSYDFDGDGYVGNMEFFIGARLDKNRDGIIDDAERAAGAALLKDMREKYIFGLEAAGKVLTANAFHKPSSEPQLSEAAKKRLVPPYATTPRRSLHLSARRVDPLRAGEGRRVSKLPPATPIVESDHGLGVQAQPEGAVYMAEIEDILTKQLNRRPPPHATPA